MVQAVRRARVGVKRLGARSARHPAGPSQGRRRRRIALGARGADASRSALGPVLPHAGPATTSRYDCCRLSDPLCGLHATCGCLQLPARPPSGNTSTTSRCRPCCCSDWSCWALLRGVTPSVATGRWTADSGGCITHRGMTTRTKARRSFRSRCKAVQ